MGNGFSLGNEHENASPKRVRDKGSEQKSNAVGAA